MTPRQKIAAFGAEMAAWFHDNQILPGTQSMVRSVMLKHELADADPDGPGIIVRQDVLGTAKVILGG